MPMPERSPASGPSRRLRVLTWHVHGNYLYYLSQAPHDFHLLTLPGNPPGHAGRVGTLPWGDNVREAPADQLARMEFDCVLYQSRAAFEEDRLQLLTPAQRALPAVYLEHDPPQQHPTNTRHWASEVEGVHLVHCTPFNALMWDSGEAPVSVVEHGIKLPEGVKHVGDKAEGLVVVNNLRKRGRRLGLDVFEQVRARVPLATTELPSVIVNGVDGYADTRIDRLVEVMHELLRDPALARRWGDAAQRTVRERFGIERFAADWDRVLRETVA